MNYQQLEKPTVVKKQNDTKEILSSSYTVW